ncbi:hypothetical protein [Providencia rettgeri]|uniref:hypothetical protein n=1 Tax=Providencia rettgeri TaxID=587 RepID=UPI0014196B90|nr:hypothetical protein [Providencia rettgeri]NIH03333.1 hypothetical protein [Providencia rettgeri]
MNSILKNKYIFMFSSIFASGSSYLLNVTLIFLLNDKSQYVNYLSINSWSIYLSTFIYLSIIDLYISPERNLILLSELLNTSFYTLCFFSFIFLALFFSFEQEYISLAIITTAISYSFIKLLTQYLLFDKKTEGVALIRYFRSLLIIISIIILYYLSTSEGIKLNSEIQLYIQGIICAIVIFFVIIVFNVKFKLDVKEMYKIYSIFKFRIAKRNLSLIFSMIHMPILYHIINKYNFIMSPKFIYSVGLILPMAYVLSLIIKEQVIIKLDSIGFNIIDKIAKSILFLLMVSFSILILTFGKNDYHQFISLITLGILISFSGCIGLNISNKGLEKYDLTVNIVVMILLLLISNLKIIDSPSIIIFLSILTISLKFIAQLLLALFGKPHIKMNYK